MASNIRVFGAWALALGLLVPGMRAVGQQAVPHLSGHVVDEAAVLKADEVERLEHSLAELERTHGSQVVFLIVPGLRKEPIEQFSRRVAETWQLGRAGIDDGVLMTVVCVCPRPRQRGRRRR